MDCPNCAAHFSDLRDICPKCYLDLREHKLSLGLQATYPGATYEELLKKLGVSHASLSSPAAPLQNSAESQIAKSAHSEQSETSFATTQPVEFENPNPNFEGIFANFENQETRHVDRVPSDRLDYYSVVSETRSESTLPDSPGQVPAQFNQEAAVRNGTHATPHSVPEHTGSQGHNDNHTTFELSPLFLEAWNEITLSQNDVTTELHFEQLRKITNTEQIKLLFDMSYEAIIDPDSEKGYQKEVQRSETRHVKSEALEHHLHGIERMINAPLLTLKALKARAEADRAKELSEAPVSVIPATRRQTIFTALFDLAFYCFLAAFMAASYLTFTDNEVWFALWNAEEINMLRLVAPVTLWALLTAILIWCMPLLSLLIWGRTIGQSTMGVRLLNKHGKNLRLSNIIVRSLCYPISLACFGYLPVLWKGDSLHDTLAKTKTFAAN